MNNNLNMNDGDITAVRDRACDRVCQFTIVRPGGLTVEPPTGVINVIKGEVSIPLFSSDGVQMRGRWVRA